MPPRPGPRPQVGSHGAVNFTLTVAKYDCPRNCSGHGTCLAGGCQCDEGWGGRACSQATQALEYGQTVAAAPAAFERAFFSLPPPTGAWFLSPGAALQLCTLVLLPCQAQPQLLAGLLLD